MWLPTNDAGVEFGHFLVRLFNRPKGEQRIARAFRPGKAYERKIALKGRPTSGRYYQKVNLRQKRLDGVSETKICGHN